MLGSPTVMATYFSPSRDFGRMAAEAMAAGVPVVAYASGALPDVIGDAGILVPEGDVGALQAAIARATADGGEIAEAGRRRALSEFSWDSVAVSMKGMYEQVLSR